MNKKKAVIVFFFFFFGSVFSGFPFSLNYDLNGFIFTPSNEARSNHYRGLDVAVGGIAASNLGSSSYGLRTGFGNRVGNNKPDVNLNSPNSGGCFGGTITIDFNVFDRDNSRLKARIAYSSVRGSFQNNIVNSVVLNDYASISELDCTNPNWSKSRNCTYSWDSRNVVDGNYFIDLNVFEQKDRNYAMDSSDVYFVLDNNGPSTSFSGFTSGVWKTTAPTTIQLNCSDSGCGCFGTSYRVDSDASEGISFGSWSVYNGAFVVSGDGNFAIDFNSSDSTGNKETVKRRYLLVDTKSPVTTSDVNSFWQKGDANIHLTCDDSNGNADVSGCFSTMYRVDSDASEGISFGSWSVYNPAVGIVVSNDGNFAIDFNSMDVAGNVEETNREYVLIDKVAPSVSSNAPVGWQSRPFSVTLTCSDSSSGCKNVYYRLDNNSWIVGSGSSVVVDINRDGNHEIDFYAVDNALNSSPISTVYAALANLNTAFLSVGETVDPVKSGSNAIIYAIFRNADGTNFHSLNDGLTDVNIVITTPDNNIVTSDMQWNAANKRSEYVFNFVLVGIYNYTVTAARDGNVYTVDGNIEVSTDFDLAVTTLLPSYVINSKIDVNGFVFNPPGAGGKPVLGADINIFLFDENNVLVDSNVNTIKSDSNGFFSTFFVAPVISSDTNYYFWLHAERGETKGDLNTPHFTVTTNRTSLTVTDTNTEVDANATVWASFLDENSNPISNASVKLFFDGNVLQMSFSSDNNKYYAFPRPGWLGVHGYKVVASKTGFQSRIATGSLNAVMHPTKLYWLSGSWVDLNSVGPLRVGFDCNSSLFCNNNPVTGGDVNFVVLNDVNTILTTGFADYNSVSNTYDFNDYNFTRTGSYNVRVFADKNEYFPKKLEKQLFVGFLDVNASLSNVFASPNIVLAGKDFNVIGSVFFHNNGLPEAGAIVYTTISGATQSTTTNSQGAFTLTVTPPNSRGLKDLVIRAQNSNGLTGETHLDLNVLKQTADVIITANVYKEGAINNHSAKPGEKVVVSYNVTPSEDINDVNIQLLFPQWAYMPITTPTIDYETIVYANQVYSSTQTFTVPKKEPVGGKTITVKVSWRNKNNSFSTQTYDLYNAFDRNYLTVLLRPGVKLDINTNKENYDFYETADVNFSIHVGFNQSVQVFSYNLGLHDVNGDLLEKIYSSTSPQGLSSNQRIFVSTDFNTGFRQANTYTLRLTTTYADEKGLIKKQVLDKNIKIGSITLSLNLDKNAYAPSDNVTASGTISTLLENTVLNGSLKLVLKNSFGQTISTQNFTGISISSGNPYNYSHTFQTAGNRGSYTVTAIFTDVSDRVLDTNSVNYLQGVVDLTITSFPSTVFVGGRINVGVSVVSVTGSPSDSLGLSNFSVWDNFSNSYSLSEFSNNGSGSYSFVLSAPSVVGSYTFTVQVSESVSGLTSVDWEQVDVNVSRHSFGVGLLLDGNYLDFNVVVPNYVSDKNVESVSSISGSSASEIDYGLIFKDGNLLGLVSTGQSYDFNLVSGSNQFDFYLIQNIRGDVNNEVYLLFTNATKEMLDSSLKDIKSHKLRENNRPSIGFGDTGEPVITVGLTYFDSGIDVNSTISLPQGKYGLSFTNAGKKNGKKIITIETTG